VLAIEREAVYRNETEQLVAAIAIPNGNRLLTKLDYLESGAFRARVLACGQPVM